MHDFAVYLLRTEHLLIMLAVWVLIWLARRLMPELDRSAVFVRLLPALPIVGCFALVWLPGLVDGVPGEKALLGLVLGAFCGHAHKLAKQSIFGNDRRIRDHPQRL
jgi:hypothetical protein